MPPGRLPVGVYQTRPTAEPLGYRAEADSHLAGTDVAVTLAFANAAPFASLLLVGGGPLYLVGNVGFVPVLVNAASSVEAETRTASDGGGTSGFVGRQNGEFQNNPGPPISGGCLKEKVQLNSYTRERNVPHSPDVSYTEEEELKHIDDLYCEECRSFFTDECEVHGPAVFIPDTPVPVGVADRARQTLPDGLEIRHSGITGSDLGVFNQSETISVGTHFGPYEGDLTDKEEAVNSRYSWVLHKKGQCAEYIDAKRETHANWMRYVNCAGNDEEQNLVAFQHKGGILYRCCRPIEPGQELLVWYAEEYARNHDITFDYLWNRKCSTKETSDVLTQVFSFIMMNRVPVILTLHVGIGSIFTLHTGITALV
ncbi:hypothetical protein AOLI_G00080910 [Acnodon oligacanthus]